MFRKSRSWNLVLLLALGGCRLECHMESSNNPQHACGPCKPATIGGSMVIACDCKEYNAIRKE